MKISYENALKEYVFRRKHGKIHIKRYIGNGGKIEVPQFIGEFPVTKIEFFAFAQSEITEIIIPDGIRYIGSHVFSKCEKLKKITFQGRIDYCFFAFMNSAIEEIEGIENIISCSEQSFFGTPFYENTETLIIGDKLVWCREKSDVIHVPDYVRTIGYRSFADSVAKKIILPETLEKIDSLAFYNSAIREIYIPDSVTEFDTNALGCCFQLEKIRFPEDFGRREKWSCIFDVNEKNYIINDTQLAVRSDNDILIYENVSCIATRHVHMFCPLRLRERQVFPEKLEYLKYVSVLADAKVNVFRNDTFRIENLENFLDKFMWRFANASRRFIIIFDFNDVYAEILFWIPFKPYSNGNSEYLRKSGLFEFYERCFVNADDGKFLDLNFYDNHILEQDIPPRIKAEIASKRIKSNYRLTENAMNNYRKYLTKSIH
ncbi:MAG: leucine-rich repeat domain-containing protein [Ruminococcus sp.]|nr:leucine-rich repeat domain-containing protein [Ruminococcus sp.]